MLNSKNDPGTPGVCATCAALGGRLPCRCGMPCPELKKHIGPGIPGIRGMPIPSIDIPQATGYSTRLSILNWPGIWGSVKMVSFVFFCCGNCNFGFWIQGRMAQKLRHPIICGSKMAAKKPSNLRAQGFGAADWVGTQRIAVHKQNTYLHKLYITLYTLHDIAVQYIILHTVDTVHTTHIGHRVH